MLTQRLIHKYLASEVDDGGWLQAHSLLGPVHAVWCPAVIWHGYLALISSSPSCSSSLFCSLSVSSAALQPFSLCVLLSPRHPSFILHLFVSICLPASCLLQLQPSSRSICLSLKPSIYLLAPVLFPALKSVCVFVSRCSGPTDSTSLITRARVALSSSSRPKSWKRSGWSSLAWQCECVSSASVWLHAWQCDKSVSFCLSCILSQHQRAQFARPVIRVRLLEDLRGPGDKRMSRLEVGLF